MGTSVFQLRPWISQIICNTYFFCRDVLNLLSTSFSFLCRWFIVHVPFSRFMRQIFYVRNIGPSPPPILRLSDGGHIENLAILPLLKKRLSKIVVADGGHKSADGEWGQALLKALTLARDKLHCSFIGLDGRDVIEDVKEKFVNTPRGHQPRSYRLAFFSIEIYFNAFESVAPNYFDVRTS